jgi:heme exporter protein A
MTLTARTAPTDAIMTDGVTRRFGSRWVLRGASLTVAAGEIVGLLGANGSGKSTLLRILATLLRSHGGRALVGGRDTATAADEVRSAVGFLAHAPGLYDDLSARENLLFAAAMLGRDPDGPQGVDAQLDRVGLSAPASARVRGFSAGMQRRLALARLLLARPRVLLLDEPYSNLDTDGIALMNGVLREVAAGGGAALVVLHETAPAEGLLDRMVRIVDGRIVARATA